MLASYFGGLSIAYSTVGIVHPFSAGLSVVFGTKHCLANCIVLNNLHEFYPKNHKVFNKFFKSKILFYQKIFVKTYQTINSHNYMKPLLCMKNLLKMR